MPIEKFSTILPAPGQGLRVMKSKLLTALGATGVLSPYTANPERIIERKILLQNAFNPNPSSGGSVTPPPTTLPQLALLFLKLESSQFDGQTNGSNITTWNDGSGNGHNFNLTGAALNGNPGVPTVDAVTTLNGHNTVRFNNNSIIGINGFNFAASPGVEMICVYKTDEPVVGNGVFFDLMRISNAVNTATPFTDNNFYESFGRTDRPNIGQPVTSMANFVCYDVSSKSDNSAYNAWINTENFFTSGAYTFSNLQQASFSTLGGGFTGVTNLFGSGNIAAVYAWNTALSASDRLLARAYVKQTWGSGFGF